MSETTKSIVARLVDEAETRIALQSFKRPASVAQSEPTDADIVDDDARFSVVPLSATSEETPIHSAIDATMDITSSLIDELERANGKRQSVSSDSAARDTPAVNGAQLPPVHLETQPEPDAKETIPLTVDVDRQQDPERVQTVQISQSQPPAQIDWGTSPTSVFRRADYLRLPKISGAKWLEVRARGIRLNMCTDAHQPPSDYQRFATEHPERLARAIESGIPAPLRGLIWQQM